MVFSSSPFFTAGNIFSKEIRGNSKETQGLPVLGFFLLQPLQLGSLARLRSQAGILQGWVGAFDLWASACGV